MSEKIKVMIIEDSKLMRRLIRSILEMDNTFEIIHEACDPIEALKMISEQKPDVISLDIKMPVVDGVSFLEDYMQKSPIPTIMVTSLNYNDSGPLFKALSLGAVDYIKKPSFDELETIAKEFHLKFRAAHYARKKLKTPLKEDKKENILHTDNRLNKNLVVFGASTGGIEALNSILRNFPANIPPMVILQHIPAQFVAPFAERLNDFCPFDVKLAQNGDQLINGKVLVAPSEKQMKINFVNNQMNIGLFDDPPLNSFCPSIDYLFNSMVAMCNKIKITAVILTGMGKDGARGLRQLKDAGAFTLAQDEETSFIFGMPKAAIDLGGACKIVSIQDIPKIVCQNINIA